MPNSIFAEKFPQINAINLVAASGTANQTLIAVGTGNTFSRIDNILIVNTDVIDHKVGFAIVNGGNVFNLGSVDVPAGQGMGGTPAIDAVPLLVPQGMQGFYHINEGNFDVHVEVAVGSGQVSVTAYWGVL